MRTNKPRPNAFLRAWLQYAPIASMRRPTWLRLGRDVVVPLPLLRAYPFASAPRPAPWRVIASDDITGNKRMASQRRYHPGTKMAALALKSGPPVEHLPEEGRS
jgi:hypothetical protein